MRTCGCCSRQSTNGKYERPYVCSMTSSKLPMGWCAWMRRTRLTFGKCGPRVRAVKYHSADGVPQRNSNPLSYAFQCRCQPPTVNQPPICYDAVLSMTHEFASREGSWILKAKIGFFGEDLKPLIQGASLTPMNIGRKSGSRLSIRKKCSCKV